MRFLPLVALIVIASPVPALAQEADTDGDGLSDVLEDLNGNGTLDPGETNPYDADTDGGGESDGSEVKALRDAGNKEDDMTYDADGDGWVNGAELLRGTNPNKPDTDGDGVKDSADPFPLNPDFDKDDDGNGLPDSWEERVNLDTAGDQNADADADGDGLTNGQEFEAGTDPLIRDTDRDGISDKDETLAGTNPRENACLQFGSITPAFPDTVGHWSKEFVTRLQRTRAGSGSKAASIIGGYTISGSIIFLPDREVTRYEFLKMALLSACVALTDASVDAGVRFSDIQSIKQFEETPDVMQRRQVVYTAVTHGIVSGYPDGTFKPDAPINRAEALSILVKAARLMAPEEATNLSRVFTDIPENAWFKPTVSTGLWFEIVRGYGDGSFQPERFITRAEAAKIIYMTMTVNPLVNGYIFPSL